MAVQVNAREQASKMRHRAYRKWMADYLLSFPRTIDTRAVPSPFSASERFTPMLVMPGLGWTDEARKAYFR
jgi:hypothetical protein